MVWSTKKRILVSCSVGWGLSILGAVMIPIMEWVIRKKVESTVIIKEGGPIYEYWHDPPVPIYLQLYMFNITNMREFMKGAKADLEQVGPYTYSERRLKYDIKWNDNGTVTYRQNRTFHFIPERSVGNESDVFRTANPLYWALYNSLKFEKPALREAVKLITGLFNEHPLMTRTLKDIIWGYPDGMLDVAKLIDPRWFYTDTVGFFINKNATNDGVYTVFTGADNISTLGVIDQYNGSKYLDTWSTKYANMINGTDGTMGPPYLPKDMLLHTFASDICRSVSGVFLKEVESPQGISLWRYTAPPYFVANASVNPDNAGFCTPKGHCLGAGVYNVTNCQNVDFFPIPVVLSFPHFLFGDEKYIHGVTGLSPNMEEHNPEVDLEPTTGLVMQAFIRLQVNIYVEPVENVSETKDIRPTMLPVFWLNESAVIDDKDADKFYAMLFTPLRVIHIMEAVIICLGFLIVLLAILYGVKKYREATNLLHLQVKSKTYKDVNGDGATRPIIGPGGDRADYDEINGTNDAAVS